MSDTPQAILQIAADLFQNNGYTQTTMTQIADKSNIALTDLETIYACKEYIVLDLDRHWQKRCSNLLWTCQMVRLRDVTSKQWKLASGSYNRIMTQ
ncbi:MAG: hypothetical protein Q9P01_01385 [Anaerolineae bacterium]|nr:hypothetical protein [Anaerolineae bacterium]